MTEDRPTRAEANRDEALCAPAKPMTTEQLASWGLLPTPADPTDPEPF